MVNCMFYQLLHEVLHSSSSKQSWGSVPPSFVETGIPGVAPFSFSNKNGISGQKSCTPTAFGKLWTTPGVRCMKHATSSSIFHSDHVQERAPRTHIIHILVRFALDMLISICLSFFFLVLGSECEHSFWWNMGLKSRLHSPIFHYHTLHNVEEHTSVLGSAQSLMICKTYTSTIMHTLPGYVSM